MDFQVAIQALQASAMTKIRNEMLGNQAIINIYILAWLLRLLHSCANPTDSRGALVLARDKDQFIFNIRIKNKIFNFAGYEKSGLLYFRV